MTKITLKVDDVFSVPGIHGNERKQRRGSYPNSVGNGRIGSRPISDQPLALQVNWPQAHSDRQGVDMRQNSEKQRSDRIVRSIRRPAR